MHEIICPHCGKAFKIDEAGYADILKQVRNREFDEALHERLELAEQEKKTAIELAEAKVTGELEKDAAKKDAEIDRLKADLKSADVARQLALREALGSIEKERDALANELEQAKQNKQTDAKLAEAKLVNELQHAAATKNAEIQDLKVKLDAIEVAQKLAIIEAVSVIEKERDGPIPSWRAPFFTVATYPKIRSRAQRKTLVAFCYGASINPKCCTRSVSKISSPTRLS